VAKFLNGFNIKSEAGSLSVLTSGLFVLLLMISVGIIDISDAYLAKRELIQIGESSVSHAAQSLDSTRYYEDGILNSGGRVPIDCNSANLMFQDEMAHKSLRKNSIDVITFECTPEQITAEISSNIVPVVSLPIMNRIAGSKIAITATIGAGSMAK
jgi:hypothetical protein